MRTKPNEDGWAKATPTTPTDECRHCGKPHLRVNGVLVCSACDMVAAWPPKAVA